MLRRMAGSLKREPFVAQLRVVMIVTSKLPFAGGRNIRQQCHAHRRNARSHTASLPHHSD